LKSASSNPWPTVRLGEVASVSTGGTPRRDRPEYWGGDIHWVTTGQIDFAVIQEGAERISEVGLRSSAAKISPAGTILMAMFGQGATRGKVGVLGIDAAFNQACAAIEPRNGYDRRFMYHYLADQYERIRALGQAGTQSNLNATLIRSIPVPNPPRQLQRFVAQILDLWDDATERIDRLIGAKGRLRDGLAQALLTGRRRLPAFAGRAWREVRIGEIAEESSDRCGERTDITVLSCTKHNGLVDSLEYFGRRVFGENLSGYKVVRRGEFAYATNHIEEGSIGLLSHRDIGLVSPMYTVFRVGEELDPRFLIRVLKTERYRQKFAALTSGSVNRRGGLRWSEFARIKTPCPERDEQSVIADILDAATREIDALTRLREAVAKQKRGLMSQLLAGRLRVPEVSDA